MAMWIISLNLITDKIFGLSFGPRILGGTKATTQTDFSYMVSVRVYNTPYCSGSILTKNHVLTAAHCSFDDTNKPFSAEMMSVVAGHLNLLEVKKREVIPVEWIIRHHKYSFEDYSYDICILKIAGQFDLTNKKQRTISVAQIAPVEGAVCTVSGWGLTDNNDSSSFSSDLLYTDIPIVSLQKCEKVYSNFSLTENVLCAGGVIGKDSCQGDSGGPLVCNGVVAGIVSYGDECGIHPAVYTSTAKYRSWIKKCLEEDKPPQSSRTAATKYYLPYLLFTYVIQKMF